MAAKQPSMDEEATSAEKILQNLLEDETFCDIQLEGSDGVKVPAVRAILGAKSPPLKALLFGQFSEATKSVVPIGFPGNVLKAVVEYVHTKNAALLDPPAAANDDSAEATKLHIGNLLCLQEAATYFGLKGLSQRVSDRVSLGVKDPNFALMLWDGCLGGGPSVPQEFHDIARQSIRTRADIVCCDAVKYLAADSLVRILKDEELIIQEYCLFQMIQCWCSCPQRKETACRMIQHIRLEKIQPSLLSTSVSASGLVSADQLLEAYQSQALAVEKQYGSPFKKPRKLPVWGNTKQEVTMQETITEKTERVFLEMEPVKDGVLRWTVSVESCQESFSSLWLGAALKKKGIFGARVGLKQDGNEMFSSDSTYGGTVERRYDLDSLRFSPGSKITFELDLREGWGRNGTLSAAVDGKPMARIFGDLEQATEGDEEWGFVPFLTFNPKMSENRAQVRILDFCHSLQQ